MFTGVEGRWLAASCFCGVWAVDERERVAAEGGSTVMYDTESVRSSAQGGAMQQKRCVPDCVPICCVLYAVCFDAVLGV